MDIRSLRVGDIIYRPDCNDTVVEIRANGIISLDHNRGIIPFESLEPIPLTDELLLNIGAKEIKIVEHHYLYIGNKEQSILLHHSRYAYVLTAEYYRISVRKPIKYLHQLQHELYDAGIELKIEL